jgi:adenylate kinase family enzyme
LDVEELLGQERDRRTTLGNRILHSETTGKKVSLDIYIKLLKPIIFSGHESRCKFVLNGFPTTTEQVEAFEQHCSTINAIILTTDKGNHVEFKSD